MKTVALATCDKFPDLTTDDRLLVEQLKRREVKVNPAVWNSHESWHCFDAVIIRSCWDYQFKPDEFLGWVREVEGCGVPLWNPARVVEWNIDKAYLKNLEELGARVIPTVWLDRSSAGNLNAILEAHDWEEAVVKPSISASAHRTEVVSRETSASKQGSLEEMLVSSGALIQKFVPEIRTNGEWSFIFFAGTFSHAVLKHPQQGDFRVQQRFRGYVNQASPSVCLIRQSKRIVDLVEGPILFARVDGIEIDGELYLMELELIEPSLFLEEEVSSAQRFADAIVSLL